MKTFTIQQRRGIDDLLCEFAFIGNSQGDESVSNDIEDFKRSKGWLSYIFKDIPLEQEAINKEVERRKKHNKDYIEQLHKENKFGEKYNLTVHLKENNLFDKS